MLSECPCTQPQGECYSLSIQTRTNSTFHFKLFDPAGLERILQPPWRARVTRVQICSASRQWSFPFDFKCISAPCARVLKKGKFILLSAIIHMVLFEGLAKNKSFLEKFYPSACLEQRLTIDLIFYINGK